MADTMDTTAKSRYEKLASTREKFLERARDSSELTLPFLIPPQEAGEHTKYATPYQGIGARGVNNLASKLLLAMVPVQTSFFKLQVDESQLGEEFGPQVKSELDLSFA